MISNKITAPSYEEIQAEAAKKAVAGNMDQLPRTPVIGNTGYSSPGDVDILAQNALYEQAVKSSMVDPGINYMDYQQMETGPVTASGYSGKTFSAPTFAAGGVRVPVSIINKNIDAAIERKRRDDLAGLKVDYEIQEIKDPIRNAIFVENQFKYYDDMTQSIADEKFDGDLTKARRYLNQEQNMLKRAGMQWTSLQRAFDSTFEIYMNYQLSPKGPAQTVFGEDMKALMNRFENEILNTENFDPKNIGQYSDFLREINQRTSVQEAAKATMEFIKSSEGGGLYTAEQIELLYSNNDYDVMATRKAVRKDFRENLAPTLLQLYGGDLEDYTPKQQEIFIDAIEMMVEQEVVDNIKAIGKYNAAARIQVENNKPKTTGSTDWDATNPNAYTRSPYSETAFNTGGETPYNVGTYNQITLPDKETKDIQISTQGGDGNIAWNKETGQPYKTKGNVNFEPRNTYLMYVADEDIGDDGAGNPVYKKGQPIDKQELAEKGMALSAKNKVRIRRYVEGISYEKRKKELSTSDEYATVPITTLVPYEMIEADMKTAYPALQQVIDSYNEKEGQVAQVITVSGYNKQYNSNYTYGQMVRNPLLKNYIILNE